MSTQSAGPWYPNSFPGCPAEQKIVMAFRRTINDLQGQLNTLTKTVETKTGSVTVSKGVTVIEDVRANLNLYNAADFPVGSMIFFTDWFVTYITRIIAGAPTWRYMTGEYSTVLASFPALGANDAGLIVYDTAFQHRYQWTGVAYQFAPGDEGSGKYVATIGAKPTGGVWQLADGSAGVLMSVGDGTTTTVTVKNLNRKRLIGADSAFSEVAAMASQFAGGAKTDDESAHTHDMGGHTHSVAIAGGTAGAGVAVPVANPGGYTTGGPSTNTTSAGSAHSHPLSNANAPLLPPSDGNGGIADHTWMVWWVRQ